MEGPKVSHCQIFKIGILMMSAGDDDECPHLPKTDANDVGIKLDNLQSPKGQKDNKMQTGVISTNV